MERISFKDIPKEMMGKLMDLETYINNSGIEMKLLELVRLRVAQINGCAYCVDNTVLSSTPFPPIQGFGHYALYK